ncbi:hypothetical protein AGIG_G8423 [Arapaima gigas]
MLSSGCLNKTHDCSATNSGKEWLQRVWMLKVFQHLCSLDSVRTSRAPSLHHQTKRNWLQTGIKRAKASRKGRLH